MLTDEVITLPEVPPPEQAAFYHGFRMHLQIIQWKMLDERYSLNPTNWGWKKDDCLILITTDKHRDLHEIRMLHLQTYSKFSGVGVTHLPKINV